MLRNTQKAFFALTLFLTWIATEAIEHDCTDIPSLSKFGAFSPKFVDFKIPSNSKNATSQFYGYIPAQESADQVTQSMPAIIFAHGSTGQWEMYQPNLELIASHGFVIVFPFIKSPEEDKHFWVTSTDGTELVKSFFALRHLSDSENVTIDYSRIIFAGHSMGASATIKAGKRYIEGDFDHGFLRPGDTPPIVRAIAAMHPGLCGPIGPPPYPVTWMQNEMHLIMFGGQVGKQAVKGLPVLMTSAENDSAFLPAPYTFKSEVGCFNKSLHYQGDRSTETPGTLAFIGFTETACAEDGARKPDGFPDGGHNCPLKKVGQNPEFPWLLAYVKQWTYLDGNKTTVCHSLLYGEDGASKSPTVKVSNIWDDKMPPTAEWKEVA